MGGSIFKILGLEGKRSKRAGRGSSPGDSETIHRIAAALGRLQPERARLVAAFAFILSRAARADLRISEAESRAMGHSVSTWAGLPEEQAALVVEIARHQNILFGATEDYIVTREFSRVASREDKLGLLHCLFAVSASDESISSVENASIAQIARELGLSHDDLVQARLRYRDKLAVLKGLPD